MKKSRVITCCTRLLLILGFWLLSISSPSLASIPVDAKITKTPDTTWPGWHSLPFEAVVENGKFEGQSVRFEVSFYGHPQFDPDLKLGDGVVLQIDEDPDSATILSVNFAQYRIWPVLACLAIGFAFAVSLTAGRAGLRGLIGTVVSVVLLIGALMLSLRFDLSPILTVIGTGLLASLLSISFLFRKQPGARRLASWSISCSFLANSLLSIALVKFLKINGQSLEGAREIILTLHGGMTALTPDKFWQVLAASLPISTLGAVFDSAVVLAVSLDEMVESSNRTSSSLSIEALSRQTLEIGRDLFTTLFLTLFFAHFGVFAPFWYVAFQTDAPILFLLNSEWITVGLCHVTTSAAGLMFSVLATKSFIPKILNP